MRRESHWGPGPVGRWGAAGHALRRHARGTRSALACGLRLLCHCVVCSLIVLPCAESEICHCHLQSHFLAPMHLTSASHYMKITLKILMIEELSYLTCIMPLEFQSTTSLPSRDRQACRRASGILQMLNSGLGGEYANLGSGSQRPLCSFNSLEASPRRSRVPYFVYPSPRKRDTPCGIDNPAARDEKR